MAEEEEDGVEGVEDSCDLSGIDANGAAVLDVVDAKRLAVDSALTWCMDPHWSRWKGDSMVKRGFCGFCGFCGVWKGGRED